MPERPIQISNAQLDQIVSALEVALVWAPAGEQEHAQIEAAYEMARALEEEHTDYEEERGAP